MDKYAKIPEFEASASIHFVVMLDNFNKQVAVGSSEQGTWARVKSSRETFLASSLQCMRATYVDQGVQSTKNADILRKTPKAISTPLESDHTATSPTIVTSSHNGKRKRNPIASRPSTSLLNKGQRAVIAKFRTEEKHGYTEQIYVASDGTEYRSNGKC